LQSAGLKIPCGSKGEAALSPAEPKAQPTRPAPLRIVDPAAVISLPGVELDLAEAEKIAQRRQNDGRLAEAAALFGQIVEVVPNHGESLLALGSFILRAGRLSEAAVLFEKAAAAQPGSAVALANLGAAYAMQARMTEAEATLRRAIAIDPRYVDAHRNLGVTMHRQGRLAEAAQALRLALRLAPGQALIERNLAAVLLDDHQAAEAAALYRRALARQPRAPAALIGLALALDALGDRPGAVGMLERAIAMAPRNPRPLLEMARLQLGEGRFDAAIANLRRAGELAPGDAAVQTALAEALIADQQIMEAAAACERAVAADPTDAKAMLVFAQLLNALDRSLDSIGVLRQAVERNPESKPARRALADALLKSGDFDAGWPAFETASESAAISLPLWQGEPIGGKRLLVDAGETIDDILLLARFLPTVAAGGVQVHLRCPASLFGLFAGLPGVASLVAPGGNAPACDLTVRLASLPRLLGLRIESIPPTLGWLRPPPERLAPWRQRLARLPAPRIGLVWRTGAGGDRRANLSLEALAQLVGRSHGSFVALNSESRTADIAAAGLTQRIVDLGDALAGPNIWGEMAAAIDGVDLLIAVDSPAAHLAGALGRPAWLLLAQPSSWCWFAERADSPWYPTLRLLRQPKPGDWTSVINQTVARLSDEETA
jgi:tetratricopeptide (TPR) repeat protein